MNITSLNYTIKLLGRVFDEKNSTVPFLNGIQRKYKSKDIDIEQPFEMALPEKENVSSKAIREFLEKTLSDSSLNLQNLLILRNGKLLFKTSVGAWDINCPKATFSACKSITSLAIGILYDEGKLSLSEKIVDIFRDKVPTFARIKMEGITIHHLLTMTSTVLFNEAEAMTQSDWIKAFFESSMKGKLGQTFNYNSLNTYMLSAIVCKKSGMTMSEFLEEKLFSPLGIKDVFWEKSPDGIEKGGWGLYIRPEDMAKIGQMVLQGGKWKSKRIISQRYLRRALKAYSAPPKEFGNYDYGYQIWLSRENDCFLFNGMFGQNVFGFKNNGILIVVNCANSELFQQSRLYQYINESFSGDFTEELDINHTEYKKLLEFAGKISKPFINTGFLPREKENKFVSECMYINGKSYCASAKNSPSTGLLPLTMQIVQNNYTKGIKEVRFDYTNGRLFVKYEENDASHIFPVGFESPERFELEFDGENYKIASFGNFYYDDNLVLKIRLDFLETPFTRFLRFVFYPDKILLMQSETPGHTFLNEQFDNLSSAFLSRPVISGIAEKIDKSYVFYRIERLFAPKTELSLKDK